MDFKAFLYVAVWQKKGIVHFQVWWLWNSKFEEELDVAWLHTA